MTSRMIIVFIAGVAVGKWLWRDGAGEDRQVGGAVSVVRDPHAARDGAGAGMGRTATADEWMRSIYQQPGGPGTADFLAYLQTLDADGLQALAEEIWLLPDEQISDEAVAHLLHRWAAVDPQHMMAAALKWKDSEEDMAFSLELIKVLKETSLGTLVGTLGAVHDTNLMQPVWRALWDREKREELMRHFIASPHPEALSFLINRFEAEYDHATPAEAEAIVRMAAKYRPTKVSGYSDAIIRWAAKDQAAALAFAQSLTDEHQRARALTACLEGLARSDPQAALARAHEVPAGLRRDFLRAAFIKWCDEDSAASLAWAQANLTGDDLLNAMGAIASGPLLGRTPEEDAALLPHLTNRDRKDALQHIAMIWEIKDSAAGLRWLASLPPDDFADLMADSTYRDAQTRHDPALFAGLLLKSPQALAQEGVMSRQLNHFLENNQPQEGLEWAARIPGTAMCGEAVRHLFFEWMESDPASAESAALALTDPALRGSALRSVAERKAGNDPAAAWAWAQQLTGPGRDEAVATALWRQMGRMTPQESVVELAALRSSGSSAELQKLTRGFAENWARTDPQAAAGWAAQLPPDEQPAAYAGLVETCASRDPAAASEWLTQLPHGAQRDAAILSFADEIRNDDPAAALTWAAAISDPVERFSAIQSIIPEKGNNRALRLLLLETPALTAADRARLSR